MVVVPGRGVARALEAIQKRTGGAIDSDENSNDDDDGRSLSVGALLCAFDPACRRASSSSRQLCRKRVKRKREREDAVCFSPSVEKVG